MVEEWRAIAEYEGYYEVSNLGRVKSLAKPGPNNSFRPEIIMKLNTSSTVRYYSIRLTKDGDQKSFLVHRLVAIAFVPNPKNKKEVNHIDSDYKNNRADNLEWVTRDENICHAWRNGSMDKGSAKKGRYRGVNWVDRLKKWEARTYIDGKQVYLGRFDEEEKAYEAILKAKDEDK